MPEREHFFDPWLTARLRFLEAIAENLAVTIQEHSPPRQRQRRQRDHENLTALLLTVAANLAYAVVAGFDPPVVAVPLAKPKTKRSRRYERQGFRQLPKILEWLQAGGVLTLHKSRERGRASTVEPTESFVSNLQQFRRFGFAAFDRVENEEIIILSRTETDHAAGTRIADWKDYTDTPATRRYRNELQRINAALAKTDLAYEGEGSSDIDTCRRKLRRVFNVPNWLRKNTVRFDLGGRLYGGWWQNLKEEHRAFIRIDGEPIADLDFKSMFPRLAYIRARKPMPPGDPYALPGFGGYREGVKRTFNAMLFRCGPLTRVPRGSRELLPSDCTGEKIRAAILARHPALSSTFEKGIGFHLMFTESQILVALLLRLTDAGITGLPMHDGVMVPRSKAGAAARTMGEIAEELTGVRLPVTRK